MNKACVQISFPVLPEPAAAVDSSVGVATYAQMELVSRLAPNGIDTLEYWKVKFCFCVHKVSTSPAISIYLQNDINGSLGKILRIIDPKPEWLAEEGIVEPGDIRTDALVLDGSGPWYLSYPVVNGASLGVSYKSSFDALGSLYKLKTTIDPAIWQPFGPFESSTTQANNYLEQTTATEIKRIPEFVHIEERYDMTLHGVVNVTYTVGGDVAYYVGEKEFLIGGNTTSEEQAYFKKHITNANWQYVAMSKEQRRIIASGVLSISEVFGPIPAWEKE